LTRVLELVESEARRVRLSTREAEQLALLGQRLTSDTKWWGAKDDEGTERSVIDCRMRPDGLWDLKVLEAVGLIAVGDLQIRIEPKIPLPHFMYLATRSKLFPRTDDAITSTDRADHLIELIVHWFLSATERLLRGELSHGYVDCEDHLEAVRGQLVPLETARAYYTGRPTVACRFEEFNEDIDLNRIIKAAAELAASGAWLSPPYRKRAKAILARADLVGSLRESDLRVEVDRLTQRYKQPVTFAKYVLSHSGLNMLHGNRTAWSFLIRTPELVESGVRSVLEEALSPTWEVRKERHWVAPGFTLNPDVVINNGAFIVDIKYKLAQSTWSRPDVYQLVAHATGFRSKEAALIYFDTTHVVCPTPVTFGDLPISYIVWNANTGVDPAQAASKLAESLRLQLNGIVPVVCGLVDRTTPNIGVGSSAFISL
jgi:5-methylcytosine-specific restriction enzyme subunit McrC